MLRAVHYRRPDLEPFDAALNALQHRSADGAEAAFRELHNSGQGGFARLLERASKSLFPAVGGEEDVAGASLTGAELQVLRGMALGLSNQAIADEQRRSLNTVRTHVSSVLRKLGVGSRGEAVATARRKELV